MSRQLQIGGIDESTYLVHEIELPVIEDLRVRQWMDDALTQAVAERKGVALIADKGVGKTVAIKKAVSAFEDAERTIEEKDAKHLRRRVKVAQSPRSDSRVEVIAALYMAITGIDIARKRRGRSRSEHDLLLELVSDIRGQNVAAIVLDEAENLSEAGVEVVRDIMSIAESESTERYTKTGSGFRSAGVGAVLVGTRDLLPRLAGSEEAGQRWVRIQPVRGLDLDEASEIYCQYLPAFAKRAKKAKKQWGELLESKVMPDGRIPIRRVENHVRAYIRRMILASEEGYTKTEQIPWDEDVFLYTLSELPRDPYAASA
jgi:type II secretory pathway predicted ATPase ExeA